jgi:hypothetical protein
MSASKVSICVIGLVYGMTILLLSVFLATTSKVAYSSQIHEYKPMSHFVNLPNLGYDANMNYSQPQQLQQQKQQEEANGEQQMQEHGDGDEEQQSLKNPFPNHDDVPGKKNPVSEDEVMCLLPEGCVQ